MKLLEDILRVLGVAGREAEAIMAQLGELAGSRGVRKLIIKLPRKIREELDENLGAAGSDQHLGIIQNVVQGHFSEQERQQAYAQAFLEIIEKEFLPTALQEATEAQRQEIKRLIRV